MNKILTTGAAILALALSSQAFAKENCALVGKFTQGATTTKFTWNVEVTRHHGGFALQGRTSDRYGVANVNGRCDKETDICTFAKQYVSGQSQGVTFYYAGKAGNEAIVGKWGYQKGQYNGGGFSAQVLNCS
ncbi:hypothetical protein SAMN05660284_02315 [Formivibrio citricus]|uniref:Uncharacterized protein n=1 Tax=Formivibrio citricus TaxID=83765 RepID=A0A1I5C2Y4_9NEIS|nr:hypothetical protein [Formivibrio citricus]SFN81287.1 hypothetical protein SAMN05660284_02315 [Formivibrio citricus]